MPAGGEASMFDDDTYESESSQNTVFNDTPKSSKASTEKNRQKQTSKKLAKKPIQQVDKKIFKTKKGEREKKFKTIVKKKSSTPQESQPQKSKKKNLNSKQTAVKAFTQDVLEDLFVFNQGKW